MATSRVRNWIFLTAIVASLHVAAEPRFWTLSGVQFEDGAVATGYFSYDDATGTIANWNVRVGAGTGPFTAWTFVPGNSNEWPPAPAFAADFYVISYSPSPVPDFWWRSLMIRPSGLLDGRTIVVPINVSNDDPMTVSLPGSNEFFENDYDGGNVSFRVGPSRKIISGSLILTPLPPPVTIVQVNEFYHPGLRHYFMTADTAEKELLDTGVHSGWERTGESFKAHAAGSRPDGSINPVCRYYGTPERGLDSHFYSAAASECESVSAKFPSAWLLESDNVFQIDVPDMATGACPAGTVPVHRLWNQRADSNHRYTTSPAVRAQMIAAGYLAEGVVMCGMQ